MATEPKNKTEEKKIERPPIVVVMGHVDHGKSTLLDFMRKSNTVAAEAGGITQHTSAYEVTHANEKGEEKRITFLDTPGHEAFTLMRTRGAQVADIAILVVAADDGVKQQTVEALEAIQKAKILFVVAINKIDKPNANPDKTKQDLAEHGVLVEGYGGDVPAVAISAKNGDGVSDLLDMILLISELEAFTGDQHKNALGVVLEAHRDPRKGIVATLLIRDGSYQEGMSFGTAGAYSPGRRVEDIAGKVVRTAGFSSPIRVVGFDAIPSAGSEFKTFAHKKEAEAYAKEAVKKKGAAAKVSGDAEEAIATIALIVKADTQGTLEAVISEIKKVSAPRMAVHILSSGVGNISESDVKRAGSPARARRAGGSKDALVVGFNVSALPTATRLAARQEIPIETFDIIYKLTERLTEELIKRRPKILVEEMLGKAKIVRIFSTAKHKQVAGGKVEEGLLREKGEVKIMRREHEIGRGKILELQHNKVRTKEVSERNDFGALIESRHEIATGDSLEMFTTVEQ